MIKVYRVQDYEGRGPWKPGLSKYWTDENKQEIPETVIELVGGLEYMKSLPLGWHYGCACKNPSDLKKWFTEIEALRLATIGYAPVVMTVNKILKQSQSQLLVASRKRFADIAHPFGWGKVFD